MRLLAGLGNPGRKYRHTRHNVGFEVVDLIVSKLEGLEFEEKFNSLFAICKIGSDDVCVLKPETFMNLSGEAVSEVARFYKVNPEDMIVVHDDIDMTLGKLRIVKGAGSGGHNGADSIINCIGTKDFWRLKIGIGRPPAGLDPADYVLQRFEKSEIGLIDKVIGKAAEAVVDFFKDGADVAMQKHNNSLVSL